MAGVSSDFVDMDFIYQNLSSPPLIANDYDVNNPDDNEALNRALATQFDDDAIDLEATCDCGNLMGVFNIGMSCPDCNTSVKPSVDRDIESSLWIRAPKGYDGLVLPQAWTMFKKDLHSAHFNYFLWLVDRNYKPAQYSSQRKAVADREAMEKRFGRHRDLNYFINHFIEIIDFILENTSIIPKANVETYRRFCVNHEHLFFPKQIAVPSKLCFIIENTNIGRYIDSEHLREGIDAVNIAASITKHEKAGHKGEVARRTVRMLSKLSAFYETYIKDLLSGKPGDYRKHVFGSRLAFTMRAVITSIPHPSNYDDLYIPYGATVQLFKYQIINELRKEGYSANDALEFVYTHVARTCPKMLAILKKIQRSYNKGRGPACLLNRNPTLRRGSTQRFFLIFKTDPDDFTISMPNTVLREGNADYDGDELNLTLMLDNLMTAYAERLSPAHYSRSYKEPRRISSSLSLPTPIVETTSNWLCDEDYLIRIGFKEE